MITFQLPGCDIRSFAALKKEEMICLYNWRIKPCSIIKGELSNYVYSIEWNCDTKKWALKLTFISH